MDSPCLFPLALILGPLLLLGFIVFASFHFLVRRKPFSSPLAWATSLALGVFAAAFFRFAWLLIQSGSSTGVVEIIYAPLYAVVAAGVTFAMVWALAVLLTLGGALRARKEVYQSILRLLIAGAVLAAGAWISSSIRDNWLEVQRAGDARLSAEEVDAMYQQQRIQPNLPVLAVLASNPSLPAERLSELASAPSAALRSPVTSPLWFLTGTPDPRSVLERVGANPRTPAEGLLALATDPSLQVAAAVAQNPSAPIKALEVLSHRKENQIAYALASNPATPPQVLEELSTHPFSSVVQLVALHPHTTAEVLKRLSQDAREEIRAAVAQNSACAPSILQNLANDPSNLVRMRVSQNLTTPASVLRKLAEDPDEKVRLYAGQRLAAENKR